MASFHFTKVLLVSTVSIVLVACGNLETSSAVEPKQDEISPFEHPLLVNVQNRRLAIGRSAVAGVRIDGTVWAWGGGERGQLGNGEKISFTNTPIVIPNLSGIVEISGSGSHFLALKNDGTVWSWGNNDRGQLGYKTKENYWATPRMINGITDAVDIAASDHSLVLDNNGNVWGFGSNASSGLGIYPPDTMPHYDPKIIYTNPDGVRVYSRWGTSVLLDRQGVVYFMGGGSFSKDDLSIKGPKKIEVNGRRIVDVAISDSLYLLGSDGYVYAQGNLNNDGQLGQGDFNDHKGIIKVKNIGKIISIAARDSSAIALDVYGRVWQWGDEVYSSMVNGGHENKAPLPVLIATIKGAQAVESSTASAIITDNGDVYFWGINGGRYGNGTDATRKYWSSPVKSFWRWK